jgi:thiamine-monophosphate kinase
MSNGEFDVISRFFARRKVNRHDVQQGIGDDCALVKVDSKHLLAISTDSLVCGTHFLPDIDPADLAYKAFMVNLSDLASMGAEPAWLSLAMTLKEVDEPWLETFSNQLFSLLDYYQMQLIGGDTTKGPLSLTLTVQGFIPEGMQLTRKGAKVGDWIFVTGSLGDSAAGLAILQDKLQVIDEEQRRYLIARHLRPQARVLMGQGLRGLATSAIDLSDGLISDLPHILKASGCGAKINLDALPLSQALRCNSEKEQALKWALSGGEDYELCFTVPEMNRGALASQLSQFGVPYTCIGQITNAANQLQCYLDQQPFDVEWRGYDHFGEQHE